jgi:hypothetical protein
MANQYRLRNQRNEESSPYRNAVYLRLFGSNIHIINGGSRSVSSTRLLEDKLELDLLNLLQDLIIQEVELLQETIVM